MRKISSVEELAELYEQPVKSSIQKVAHYLTPLYQRWIEGSRFCILSTVGPDGVHGSPRGDDGPVVVVQDRNTLLMPDWRGNNRLDCLRDIVGDGRVALLFLVPGNTTTVRANGRAILTDDIVLRQRFEKKGRLPATVIVIDVAEVYTQCAKALLRSGIWQRDDASAVPKTGEILADMTNGETGGPGYDEGYAEYAKPRMW